MSTYVDPYGSIRRIMVTQHECRWPCHEYYRVYQDTRELMTVVALITETHSDE
jgi:hypothetical protein